MILTIPKVPLIFVAATLASCVSANQTNDALMDEIEAKVTLPSAEYRLDDYARSYAFSENQKVTGHYLMPSEPLPADAGCSMLTADGEDVPCPSGWRARSDERQASELKAGERRWIDSEKDLPFISDGGCSMIAVEYDLRSSKVSSIACNGEA